MKPPVLSIAALLLALGVSGTVQAQVSTVPNSMSFQGRLATPSGNPVPNGTYSVLFSLYDASTGGTLKWSQTRTVTVSNGTFSVVLGDTAVSPVPFPAGTFNGNLWLQIKVGSDPALSPRIPLLTVPYAFKAGSVVDGSVSTNSLANNSVTAAKILDGTITASKFAPNILNPLAWLVGGNSGTNPTSNFIGTTDNQPLAFRINNRQALLLSYAENTTLSGSEYRSVNVLGGSQINLITPGVVGATVAGGGFDSFSSTDYPNRALADFSTVSGGDGNIASSIEATIGGGFINEARGENSTVGGGFGNTADNHYSFVGGGGLNTAAGEFSAVGGGANNNATANYSLVAGGQGNTASGFVSSVLGGDFNLASGERSTVGGGNGNVSGNRFSAVLGGFINSANGYAGAVGGGENNKANFEYTTVGGGANNTANSGFSLVAGGQGNTASGYVSSVLGGDFNLASGNRSTVVGGNSNTASGFVSLAAGFRAKAVHDGAFVWNDSTNVDFASTGANQFLIRATGNVGINTNSPTNTLDVNGNIRSRGGDFILNGRGGGYGNSGGAGRAMVDAGDGSSIGYGGLVINFFNDYGQVWVDSDLYVSGAVYQSSDARYKKEIEPLSNSLDTILKMRGVTYLWDEAAFPKKTVSKSRQVGFIAQEVEKLCPDVVQTDKRGYKSVNYVGVVPVLVEAVKAQQKQIEELKAVKSENLVLKAQLAELMARMNQLEQALQHVQK